MRPKTFRYSLLVGALTIMLAAVPAVAENSGKAGGPAPSNQVTSAAAQAPGDEGPSIMLRGTDLARMLRRDTANVSVRTSRATGMAFDAAGGFRSVLVVQVTPEGNHVISCIASEQAAERIFAPRKNAETKEP